MDTEHSLVILGSTGSIGENVLKVVDAHPERLRVVGLSAHTHVLRLAEQVRKYRPRIIALSDESYVDQLQYHLPSFSGTVLAGAGALAEIATTPDADTVVVAVVGSAGYHPTLAAIGARKRICLANKETLVVAGSLVMEAARKNRVEILPIDSEHSAIWQCLKSGRPAEVEKILLTGSGGPFRTRPLDTFSTITKAEALAHPNWSMGAKITIDSATMMNKAFEIIEASWLFDISATKVEVVLHPQSVVHSAVQYADGSVIAQMGTPDMKLPIQYALLYPDRLPAPPALGGIFDLSSCPNLSFEKPDEKRYPALPLARQVIQSGGTYPAVLNAADEAAVELFLDGKIRFTDIHILVESAVEGHKPVSNPNLDDLDQAGKWAATWVKTRARNANASAQAP